MSYSEDISKLQQLYDELKMKEKVYDTLEEKYITLYTKLSNPRTIPIREDVGGQNMPKPYHNEFNEMLEYEEQMQQVKKEINEIKKLFETVINSSFSRLESKVARLLIIYNTSAREIANQTNYSVPHVYELKNKISKKLNITLI